MFRIIIVGIVSALLFAPSLSFADKSNVTTYRCHGTLDTTGDVTLTTIKDMYAYVNAHWQNEYDKFPSNAVCVGNFVRQKNAYNYFNVTRTPTCPLDYIRIAISLNEKGEGVMSLVSKTGSDTHDYSGYTYAYFYCNTN